MKKKFLIKKIYLENKNVYVNNKKKYIRDVNVENKLNWFLLLTDSFQLARSY